jgi:hypothetical protein
MLHINPHVQLEVVRTLNLATLMSVDLSLLEHDCLEVIDEVCLSWPDLTDQPISHLNIEYFTDGRSFIQDSTLFAGYAIVILGLIY